MKRWTIGIVALALLPALARAQMCPCMWWRWGWWGPWGGPWWGGGFLWALFGIVVFVLFLAVIIMAIVWLYRQLVKGPQHQH